MTLYSCVIILIATQMNDPLLQTLLEQDRILSKSKLTPSSSKTKENTNNISSEDSSPTNDNSSKDSLDRGKLTEDAGTEGSLCRTASGSHCLPADIQPVDENEIIQNRLSLEQIKDIPKFANYHPGEPNKVRESYVFVLNPLRANINMYILLAGLLIFLIVPVQRIWLNIKTFHV